MTGTQAASESESQATTQGGVYEKVKEYICHLPQLYSQKLSEHAAHAQHEDVLVVPDDAVKAPEGLLSLLLAFQTHGHFYHSQAASLLFCAFKQ